MFGKRSFGKILLAAMLAAAVLFCALALFEHHTYRERIAVNGGIYTQKGMPVPALPAGSVESGILLGIRHRTTAEPRGDGYAVNLDSKYAGNRLYRSEDGRTVYLEDYRGCYIPFARTG